MMTVAKLIRKLEEMPEVIDWLGRSTSTDSNAALEIFEDIHGNVIIQGLQ